MENVNCTPRVLLNLQNVFRKIFPWINQVLLLFNVNDSVAEKSPVYELDVHGSVHPNIKLIERTNKMQPSSRIFYSNVS